MVIEQLQELKSVMTYNTIDMIATPAALGTRTLTDKTQSDSLLHSAKRQKSDGLEGSTEST